MTRTTAPQRRERFRLTRPYLGAAITVNLLTVAFWVHTHGHAKTADSVLVLIGYATTFALLVWSLWPMCRLSK